MSAIPPAARMPATGAGSYFPAELLEQLKEQLPEALFATLSGTVATYEKQLDSTKSQLQYAQLKIQVLEEHLRLRRIAKYGPGSEKLSDLQLEMLEEEPGVSRQEVAAESAREPLPGDGEEKNRKRRLHPGRQTLPADLFRLEKVIACTPEQCACSNCGNVAPGAAHATAALVLKRCVVERIDALAAETTSVPLPGEHRGQAAQVLASAGE